MKRFFVVVVTMRECLLRRRILSKRSDNPSYLDCCSPSTFGGISTSIHSLNTKVSHLDLLAFF